MQVSEQERLLMEAEARDSGEQLREMAEKVRSTYNHITTLSSACFAHALPGLYYSRCANGV